MPSVPYRVQTITQRACRLDGGMTRLGDRVTVTTAERAVRGGGQPRNTAVRKRRADPPSTRGNVPLWHVHALPHGNHRAERILPHLLAEVAAGIDLDGGARMSKRIFLAMASLAALVLSSGASSAWMR